MVVRADVIREKAVAAIAFVATQARVRAAYLFGSHVEGTADRFSDIDIAAFVEDAGYWDLERRVRMAVDAQEKVGDDIEVHFFSADSLERAPRASFTEYVLRHGIRIWPEESAATGS